jgi:hypothetical protein
MLARTRSGIGVRQLENYRARQDFLSVNIVSAVLLLVETFDAIRPPEGANR